MAPEYLAGEQEASAHLHPDSQERQYVAQAFVRYSAYPNHDLLLDGSIHDELLNHDTGLILVNHPSPEARRIRFSKIFFISPFFAIRDYVQPVRISRNWNSAQGNILVTNPCTTSADRSLAGSMQTMGRLWIISDPSPLNSSLSI